MSASKIEFLGVLVDAQVRRLFLPERKISAISEMAANMVGSGRASFNDLERLMGWICFATVVMPALCLMRTQILGALVDAVKHLEGEPGFRAHAQRNGGRRPPISDQFCVA